MNDYSFQSNQKTVHNRIRSLRDRATNTELIVKGFLDKLNERYIFQKGFIKGYYCIVDFYLPKRKLCIEIDGGYHESKEQKAKDMRKDLYLHSRGFSVLRLTNDVIKSINVDQFKSILK